MAKRVTFEVTIDFDAASRAWRNNKKVLKNGCFEYKPAPKYNLRSGRQYQTFENNIKNKQIVYL